MLINNHNIVQEKKYLLLLVIIDILKEYTSPENHMKKTELCNKIEQRCGFMPARNTVYDKLNSLEYSGFPIVQDSLEGVYYDGHELSDGELRFLVDSVLYSDFVTLGGADEMIEALTAFGSPAFQKYIRRQKYRAGKTRKNMQTSVFLTIEEVQSAIFDKRQISCNQLTYLADLTTENVYPEDITVNPYELVFKNGKYYLLGALNDHDKILSWRVDRLCNVKILESRCREIPQLKEIEASGGMSAYADKQPDLCGGVVETFKIQCADIAIEEIIDVFGQDFSILPKPDDDHSPDVLILKVKTTRESIKSWAIKHALQVVILEPHDISDEIFRTLSAAWHQYGFAGKPLRIRARYAASFQEAVRLAEKYDPKRLCYSARSISGKPVKIEMSLLKGMPELELLSLHKCEIEGTDFLTWFPNLKSLFLSHSVFNPDALKCAKQLNNLRLSRCDCKVTDYISEMKELEYIELSFLDIADLSFLLKCLKLKRIDINCCENIRDCAVLAQFPQLEELTIVCCDKISDYSFLKQMKQLKKLHIQNENFGYEQCKELQAYLPDCYIEGDGYHENYI